MATADGVTSGQGARIAHLGCQDDGLGLDLALPPGLWLKTSSLVSTSLVTTNMARSVDIKILFEQTDMVPGPNGIKFQRNVL